MPDESRRKNIFKHLYEFVINYGILYGEVYATSPRIEGVAVWLDSERSGMTLWKIIRAGGLPLYIRTGKKFISQVLFFARHSASIRSAFAPSRHWYLFYLAVDPGFRGRGHATELLKPMLSRIDGEGSHGYLETYTEKNVDMYKRYGFKVIGQGRIPTAGVDIWSMLRPRLGPEPLLKPLPAPLTSFGCRAGTSFGSGAGA